MYMVTILSVEDYLIIVKQLEFADLSIESK